MHFKHLTIIDSKTNINVALKYIFLFIIVIYVIII